MFGLIREKISRAIADYLDKASPNFEPAATSSPQLLRENLRPGDVLLVEGDRRISMIIKYLTQSTWSHAAFYIGDALGGSPDGTEPMTLIEADLQNGVVAVPLSKYEDFHTRICRPVGLTDEDRKVLIDFMVSSLGLQYDLKNVTDLLRYLFPLPPVPVRFRRRMLALGSGDPTRAICSTLIAQAFQAIRYPVLPLIRTERRYSKRWQEYMEREILHIRHHSLYTPRDFDISPYFAVIKPNLEHGFNYKGLNWAEEYPPEITQL